MSEEKKVVISYRIDKAEETLSDAQLLFDSGKLGACINRLYYAAFYALNALLLQNGLSARTHKGVRILFMTEFVNKNIISKELAIYYSHLFDSRLENDYEDFFIPETESVREWLKQCYEFIDVIKNSIKI